MNKLVFIAVSFLVVLLSAYQVVAYESSSSLGSVASNIYGTTSIVARLMWAACVIIGIALLITAFTQIQVHRQNPKLMPLTKPVTYIFLGLGALSIPFAERILGLEDGDTKYSQGRIESASYSNSKKSKKKNHNVKSIDIDNPSRRQ